MLFYKVCTGNCESEQSNTGSNISNCFNVAPNTPTQLSGRDLGIGYTYQWYPPVGINFNDIKNPTFNYNAPTEYTITLTPPDGTCPTVDTLLVTIDTRSHRALNVPNAWSPNGDGHNDKLYPLTINMKEA